MMKNANIQPVVPAQVSVNFSFFLPPDEFVSESELSGLDHNRLSSIALQEGSLKIIFGDTQVDLSDALLWMITGLCFDGIVALHGGDSYELDFATSDEKISLRRDGQYIELVGAYQEAVRFPAGAFETALFAAGERFVSVVDKLWPNRSDAEVSYLSDRVRAARSSLLRS